MRVFLSGGARDSTGTEHSIVATAFGHAPEYCPRFEANHVYSRLTCLSVRQSVRPRETLHRLYRQTTSE
jgi:hypothetical protein